MEDTSENSAARLTMKALLESDKKPVLLLVGNAIPSIKSLMYIAEHYTVVKYNELQEIEETKRSMEELLFIDDSIEHFKKLPPALPIQAFEPPDEIVNPFRTKKRVNAEWKNKLKSLYRVKI